MRAIPRMVTAFLLLFMTAVTAHAIDVSAASAVLYEAETGRVLFSKNAEQQRPIASTTKIMTALLVVEHGGLDETVTIRKECTGKEGTSLYLKPGEQLTVRTLLYGLMLQSGNDAAEVLACHVAGDIPSFVAQMNARAQELGMTHTRFLNPHGLPAEGHGASALDMARLTAAAMQNEDFRAVVSAKSYSAEGHTFTNHNRLLRMREEIDGVKTGFTRAAGRCLVSSCLRGEMRLVAVTLADPDDWDDHLALYDYGYGAFARRSFAQKDAQICAIPVVGSGKAIPARAADTLLCVEEKETLSNTRYEIYAPRFCYAPVKAGDVVGELRLVRDGSVVASCDLLAGEDAALPEEPGLLSRLFSWLK